jgi:hypothetical protein
LPALRSIVSPYKKEASVDIVVKGIDTKLGTNGLTFWISNPGGGQVGRLELGKARLRWFKGSAHKNGYEVSIPDFIAWLEARPVKKLN